jgi:AhpD family alkylhydroperoxidase
LLEGVQAQFRKVPNIFKTLANSYVALDRFLHLHGALAGGVLSEAFQEQITFCVYKISGCNYCLADHTAISKEIGLSEEETISSKKRISTPSKI